MGDDVFGPDPAEAPTSVVPMLSLVVRSVTIPRFVLLLSPRRRHESDSLVKGVCTTVADGGSPSAVLRPPFLAEDKGGVLPTPSCGFGAGEGVGVAASRNTHLRGLPCEGVVTVRPAGPPAGRRDAPSRGWMTTVGRLRVRRMSGLLARYRKWDIVLDGTVASSVANGHSPECWSSPLVRPPPCHLRAGWQGNTATLTPNPRGSTRNAPRRPRTKVRWAPWVFPTAPSQHPVRITGRAPDYRCHWGGATPPPSRPPPCAPTATRDAISFYPPNLAPTLRGVRCRGGSDGASHRVSRALAREIMQAGKRGNGYMSRTEGEALDAFDRFATAASTVVSRAPFFCFCVILVVVWVPTLALMPVNTSQLIINTVTTIVTFLLVALLQNTQTRSDAALQKKLNAIADALADLMVAQSQTKSSKDLTSDVRDLRQAVGLEDRQTA